MYKVVKQETYIRCKVLTLTNVWHDLFDDVFSEAVNRYNRPGLHVINIDTLEYESDIFAGTVNAKFIVFYEEQ